MNNDQNMNNGFQNNVNGVSQNNNVMNNYMMNNVPKKNNTLLIIGVIFVIVIVIIIILSLTGVLGGNSLKCVNSVEMYGMLEEDSVTIYYDDSDNPTRMVFTMKTSFTEDSKFTQNDLKESFDKKVEDYKKLGANVSVTSDENSITYTITVGKDNVDAFFDMMDSSYDSVKELYENRGFTCS